MGAPTLPRPSNHVHLKSVHGCFRINVCTYICARALIHTYVYIRTDAHITCIGRHAHARTCIAPRTSQNACMKLRYLLQPLQQLFAATKRGPILCRKPVRQPVPSNCQYHRALLKNQERPEVSQSFSYFQLSFNLLLSLKTPGRISMWLVEGLDNDPRLDLGDQTRGQLIRNLRG